MKFILSSPDYNITLENIKKIKVNLRSGVAEIYEKHQDLLGKINNNIIEVERTIENRVEKLFYVIQDGIFLVTNLSNETKINLFAKNICIIDSNLSIKNLSENYQEKKKELDNEIRKLSNSQEESIEKIISSKILLLQEEIEFLKQCINFSELIKS
jgi:F0F1-type ATP synthase epsilon subunit